jgi:hypothetical protein
MDVSKILAWLRLEREHVEESIVSLERLAGRRRGRPPAWLRDPKRRGRLPGGGGSGTAGGGSGTPLPAYPRPRLEDCPTRRRRTPGNPELKN